MNKISLQDLPQNHLHLINITEIIWSCDFNQIPNLITILKAEIQNGDITIPAITAIVDVISSKQLHQLRFFTELLQQIYEAFDFHLSPTYYFINKSLLEALVTLKIIKNSTIQLKSYRTIDDIYHIYPQNTVNHCVFWDNSDML